MSELYYAETDTLYGQNLVLGGRSHKNCLVEMTSVRDYLDGDMIVERRIYATTPCGEIWGKVVSNHSKLSRFVLLVPSCGDVQKRPFSIL